MQETIILFLLSAIMLIAFYLMHSKIFHISLYAIGITYAVYLGAHFIKFLKSRKYQITIKHITKVIIYLIPVAIILFLLYMNLAPHFMDTQTTYSLDVGSNNENSEKILAPLSPVARISDKITNGTTFRELKDELVYSSIKIPTNTKKIDVSVRFKDNFPEDSQGFYLGAQDQEIWHYQYKPIYLPKAEQFLSSPYIENNATRLYFLNNQSETFSDVNEFINNIPQNAIIATNFDIKQQQIKLDNYVPSELKITTPLRGSPTLYVYAKGDLNLSVSKKDLNWYENEDPLSITIYDSNNVPIANATIPDDGITNASRKQTEQQETTLFVPDVAEGVYKIVIADDSDMIIKEIDINQNKLVVDGTIFLAGNEQYGIASMTSKIYSKANKDSVFSFSTYHKQGFQNVVINNQNVNVNNVTQKFNVPIKKSNNLVEITSPKNDLIINSVNYFSFTQDSYFEPFTYKVTGIENAGNADYLLTDYKPAVEDNGWLIGTAEFNLDELYVKDNTLSILLNAKHLGNEQYLDYVIPVDYVNVTVFTSPK